MFKWQSAYSVGIPSIDAQHQKLFAIADQLHSAMTNGRGAAVMGPLLDELVRYTVAHFAHEESLMRLHGYQGLEAHQAEHQALTRRVSDFRGAFERGRAVITVQVLTFLSDWLVKHIQESDLKYAPHLKKRAIA